MQVWKKIFALLFGWVQIDEWEARRIDRPHRKSITPSPPSSMMTLAHQTEDAWLLFRSLILPKVVNKHDTVVVEGILRHTAVVCSSDKEIKWINVLRTFLWTYLEFFGPTFGFSNPCWKLSGKLIFLSCQISLTTHLYLPPSSFDNFTFLAVNYHWRTCFFNKVCW